MSTLEKTINLLYKMPEHSLEIIYDFIKSLQTPENDNPPRTVSAFGIAHEYANPALIETEKGVWANEMAKKHAPN